MCAAFSSGAGDGTGGAGFESSGFSEPGGGAEARAELAAKTLVAINETIRRGIVRKGDLSWQRTDATVYSIIIAVVS